MNTESSKVDFIIMLVIISTLILVLSSFASLAASEPVMHWTTEEGTVLDQALCENKPIVLALVGKDFCPWSQKMIGEVLSQVSFVEKMKNQAIVWQYPLYAEGDLKEERIREKYKIDECPSILLLDPKGREFARFGYLPLDANGFAELLLETIEDFKEICIALEENQGKNDARKWLEFYRKAKQFSSADFKKMVLERGVKEDSGTDLLIEKYIYLLEQNKLKSPAVQVCKKMLIERDPENRLGTHFKIAMAEYHKSVKAKTPKKALKPILRYLERFEEKDKENVWNAEMVIANYLFAQHIKEKAIAYAKKAYEHAPDFLKESIASSISYMESQ